MYQFLLFDLDGTLTESGEGILKSVQYALAKMGITPPEKKELLPFIGPPLIDSFTGLFRMSREEGKKAVAFYRERFSKTGIFENKLYPHVIEMLSDLKKSGFSMATASSKPEPFVRTILDHFGMTPYFDEVVGATFDGRISDKVSVIAEALRRTHTEHQRDAVLMIGDKPYDVLGARQLGIDCAAVSYGYGTREELEAVHPLYIADSVPALAAFLLSRKKARTATQQS